MNMRLDQKIRQELSLRQSDCGGWGTGKNKEGEDYRGGDRGGLGGDVGRGHIGSGDMVQTK